jgi:hypothetical protein
LTTKKNLFCLGRKENKDALREKLMKICSRAKNEKNYDTKIRHTVWKSMKKIIVKIIKIKKGAFNEFDLVCNLHPTICSYFVQLSVEDEKD